MLLFSIHYPAEKALNKLFGLPSLNMGELSGQRLLPNFKKDLDVARHDVLMKFDRIPCVKSLTATRRNLVIT